MSKLEEIQEQYDIGYKVFEILFSLSDKELKAKLQSIVGNELNIVKMLVTTTSQ